MMEIKKMVKEWEICDKENKAAKFKEEVNKLVFQRFHK